MEEKMHQRCLGIATEAASSWESEGNSDWLVQMEDGHINSSKEASGIQRSVGPANRQRPNGNQAKVKEVHASAADLRELLEKQNYKCAACRIDLRPDVSEIDHIVARSDGGDNAPSNLQWLCKPCNRAKGDMSMSSFIAMVERIANRRASL